MLGQISKAFNEVEFSKTVEGTRPSASVTNSTAFVLSVAKSDGTLFEEGTHFPVEVAVDYEVLGQSLQKRQVYVTAHVRARE